jgi:hypothetical protein
MSASGSGSPLDAPARTPDPVAPLAPGGGPVAGGGSGVPTGGGTGSSGSSGSGGMPLAVLADPASTPAAFGISVLAAPEHRITWWYPDVVVGPG